jgi:hypothetical protein
MEDTYLASIGASVTLTSFLAGVFWAFDIRSGCALMIDVTIAFGVTFLSGLISGMQRLERPPFNYSDSEAPCCVLLLFQVMQIVATICMAVLIPAALIVFVVPYACFIAGRAAVKSRSVPHAQKCCSEAADR